MRAARLARFAALLGLALVVQAAGCKKKTDTPSPLSGVFEGTLSVRFDSKSGEPPLDLDITLKRDNVRVELPSSLTAGALGGGKAWGVFRAGEKKGFVAIAATKQAYVLDLEAAGDDLKKAVPAARGGLPGLPRTPRGASNVKRTGQKSTVAGVPCEDWELHHDGERALVCGADESASWLKLPSLALPDDIAVASELLDGKHFPLRVIAYEGTREASRIEVTKLLQRAVPDTDFQVPAGFTSIDVQQMLKVGAPGGPAAMPGLLPPGLTGLEDMPIPGSPGMPLNFPAQPAPLPTQKK